MSHFTHLWVMGWGTRVVVSTTAFHAMVRGSFQGPGGLKETTMFLPHPLVKLSIVGIPRDRGVYVHKNGLKPISFHS